MNVFNASFPVSIAMANNTINFFVYKSFFTVEQEYNKFDGTDNLTVEHRVTAKVIKMRLFLDKKKTET